jgi:hypothetical protein
MSAPKGRSRFRERHPHFWFRERCNGLVGKNIDADGPGNVSNALLAAIGKGQSQAVADLIVHTA